MFFNLILINLILLTQVWAGKSDPQIDAKTYNSAKPQLGAIQDACYGSDLSRQCIIKHGNISKGEAVKVYLEGREAIAEEIKYQPGQEILGNFVESRSTSLCKAYNNRCVPKLNPSAASNLKRPDQNMDCQKYTFIGGLDSCDNGQGIADCLNSTPGSKAEIYFSEFLNSKYGCRPVDLKYGADLGSNPSIGGCIIEAIPCDNFFVSPGTLKDVYYPAMIKALAATPRSGMTNCKVFAATVIRSQNNVQRFIYDDDKFAWFPLKQGGSNQPKYLVDTDNSVRISDEEIKTRLKDIKSKNPEQYCSDEQTTSINELIGDPKVNNETKELAKAIMKDFGDYLNASYLAYYQTNADEEEIDEEEEQEFDVSKCTEVKPKPEVFTNSAGITVADYCTEKCKVEIVGNKTCNKRCLKGKKNSIYYDDNTGRSMKFDTSSFRDISGKFYQDGLEDYNTCLVAAGVKMSKEKKWETAMAAGGMTANLLMGLYGLYQQTSMSEDQFALQLEMLKQSDPCYSLNPNKTVMKGGKKRGFFGWIFSGLKSTYKEQTPYESLSTADPAAYAKLSTTYELNNPLTGSSQNMTPYDICIINKALASMGQFSQNQMLCNQLMGMGLLNRNEYKACLLGKDINYGKSAPGAFASKSAPATTPAAAAEEEKEDEEKAADDKAGSGSGSAGGGSGGGGGGTPSSADNSRSPDYLRNPYYRNTRSGQGLDYSGRPYGYEPSLSQQGSTDLKQGDKTVGSGGSSQNAFYDRLTGVHDGIRNNLAGTND